MSEKNTIIGMADLLDEVSRDLDDFRRKHPGDYSLKNITMWWDLEKDRLMIRHKEARVARKFVSRRWVWAFVVGSVTTFAAGIATTLLLL